MSTKMLSIAAFAALLSLASFDARAAGVAAPGRIAIGSVIADPMGWWSRPVWWSPPAPVVVAPVVCGARTSLASGSAPLLGVLNPIVACGYF